MNKVNIYNVFLGFDDDYIGGIELCLKFFVK